MKLIETFNFKTKTHPIWVVLIFIVFFTTKSIAQEIMVAGIIIDEKEKSIPYANIDIVNQETGVVSNKKGEFRVFLNSKLNDNDSLKISCIGFKPK